MTTAVFTYTDAETPNVIQRVADTAAAYWQSARYHRHQRRSVRQFQAMSDHQLRDMGIHRSEITSVVHAGTGFRRYHA